VVKRLIGMPGDTLSNGKRRLFRNGQRVNEHTRCISDPDPLGRPDPRAPRCGSGSSRTCASGPELVFSPIFRKWVRSWCPRSFFMMGRQQRQLV